MIEEWIRFDVEESWVLIAALVAFLMLLVKEWIRSNKKNRALRILVSFTVIFALLMIWMKPAYQSSSRSSAILLLTDGYSQKQVDSLNRAYSFSQIVHFDSLSYSEKLDILKQHSAMLVGEGISTDQIKLWEEFDIKYLSGIAKKRGVTKIRFDKEVTAGEELEVKGKVEVDQESWLKFRHLDQTIDSIKVSPKQPYFTFRKLVKTAGRFVYQLTLENKNGVIDHSLPVIVNEAPVYKIMMINAFPTFELKYLKNHLAYSGHALSVRNQITRGRYKFEFFNRKASPFYRLNEALFKDYDLLVIDRETLINMSQNQLNALKSAIENGLGLFVMPDEELFERNTPILNFRFQPHTDAQTVITILQEERAIDSYGYFIEDEFGVNFSVKNVSAYKRLGLGKVAITVLQNTYNLLLEGNKEAYTYLWKEQLEAIARQPRQIKLTYDWPSMVDQPVILGISGVRNLEKINADDVPLPPIQDLHIPTKWLATFWPNKEGWHKVRVNEDSAWLYVNEKQEWEALQKVEQQQANQRAFTSIENREASVRTWQTIKPIWFYLLFLLSVGYLWLEPKLS